MPALHDRVGAGRIVESHRPSPRVVVDDDLWRDVASWVGEGQLTLLGLWGDVAAVHMAVLDESAANVLVVTRQCPHGRFPSVGRLHPPAIRLERAMRDLFGLEPDGLPDPRPWLDHGRWDVESPLAPRPQRPSERIPPRFLTSEGEGLHQVPVGPVHAGIIEPGHFRFTANGETVVRLEERLGYTHKGIEGLLQGAPIERAARLAARTSGDSTVAYSLAFARAVEASQAIEIPPRALWLRALMAELERLANHFGDIGAICNDAGFALMQAHCAVLREHVLRISGVLLGHRLMMDRVVPGGVAVEPTARGFDRIRAFLSLAERTFPALVELYDNTASLQNRTVGTGTVSLALARQFGCGGFVGRASGRTFDARRALAYPPYDQLSFEVPCLDEGDVDARVWIRIREVEQSLALVDQILGRMPRDGTLTAPLEAPGSPCEGLAIVEGFRGDVLAWVRLDRNGKVERCHLRDPSWFQWPVLEAAIESNIVADFPLCNKSFNCSYSGHDL